MPFELLRYILKEYLKAIAVSLRKRIVTFSMPFNELEGSDCPAPWQTVGQSVPNYFLTEFHNLVIFHFSFVSIQLLLYNCGFAFLYSFFVFSDSEKKIKVFDVNLFHEAGYPYGRGAAETIQCWTFRLRRNFGDGDKKATVHRKNIVRLSGFLSWFGCWKRRSRNKNVIRKVRFWDRINWN